VNCFQFCFNFAFKCNLRRCATEEAAAQAYNIEARLIGGALQVISIKTRIESAYGFNA